MKTERGIVVIDAGMSSGLTSRYRKIIEKEFESDDFRYVINSHGHHDHYRGNIVFKEVRVVAHENALEEISVQWKNQKKVADRLAMIAADYEKQMKELQPGSKEWIELFTQKTRCSFASKDAADSLPVKQPDLTFTDSLNLDMGDVTLELIHLGRCHSNSDLLICVPELHLLFTGDLFFKYGRPSMNEDLQPDLEKWQRSLAWLEKRDASIDKIIGGHGQILSRDDLESFMRKIGDKVQSQDKNRIGIEINQP
jgi:glyoxylase-like metal-dependent hydrolase (beta-lactamase superfamily II)